MCSNQNSVEMKLTKIKEFKTLCMTFIKKKGNQIDVWWISFATELEKDKLIIHYILSWKKVIFPEIVIVHSIRILIIISSI